MITVMKMEDISSRSYYWFKSLWAAKICIPWLAAGNRISAKWLSIGANRACRKQSNLFCTILRSAALVKLHKSASGCITWNLWNLTINHAGTLGSASALLLASVCANFPLHISLFFHLTAVWLSTTSALRHTCRVVILFFVIMNPHTRQV